MTQPLQPAGVQAVVQNLQGFLNGMVQMNQAMQNATRVAQQTAAQMTAAGQAAGNSSNVMQAAASKVMGGFSALGGVVGSVGSGILKFFGDFLSTTLGFIAANTIGRIAQQLGNLIDMIGNAATELQLLTVRLDNLIALQMRAADANLTFEQSMIKVKGATADALEWITRMSFATPFNVDQIQNAYTLQLAMGFTTSTTKDLTKAMMDFVAGAGLSNEVMERIIYNLAQMKNQGKVTGTELRDLARGAFVPVDEILKIAAKNLGIAADGMATFRKEAAEGKISVDEFFKAFVQFAGEAFPDAAEKMNVTMTSFMDNLKDFFKIMLGWNTFGPVVARIAGILNEALKGLITPAMVEIWRAMGQALLELFNAFQTLGKEVSIAANLIFNALGIRLPTLQGFLMNVIRAILMFAEVIKGLGREIYNFTRTYILPFIDGIRNTIGGAFQDTAKDAVGWGANIIKSLAEGIMKAAASVITAAMNFITGLFKAWLAPGSPPAVLPDLLKWGAKTWSEYLRGFSMADYSVLDSLQNSLKGALDALVSLGSMGKEAGDKLFKGLSKDLIKAIAEFNKTGEMSQEIFDKLAKIGGGFGKELAELLKKQVALAKATEAAEKAQKALNAAQEATKAATANVNKLTREYNALLRAGTDKATLKQKLKELNAAEQEREAAREREKAAEKANEEAKKALDPLKEAVALQEKLIQQLIELAKLEAKEKGGDGGGGGGGGGGGAPDSIFDAIEEGFDNLFETIKQNLLDKLGGVWDDLKKQWMEVLGPFWETLKEWWNMVIGKILIIWGNLKRFWDENGPAIEDAVSRIFNSMLQIIGLVVGTVLAWLLDSLVKLSDWFVQNGPNITTIITGIGNFFVWLKGRVQESLPTIRLELDLLTNLILNLGTVIIALAAGDWAGAWEAMKITSETAAHDIETLALEYLENALRMFGIKWDLSLQNLSVTGYNWGLEFGRWWINVWDDFTEKLANVKEWIDTQIESWIKVGSDLIQGLLDGIESKSKELLDFIKEVVEDFIGKAKKVLGIQSPSSVFAGIGRDMMQGLIDGVLTKIPAVAAAIVQAIKDGIAAALEALGIGSPSKVYTGIGKQMMSGLALGVEKTAALPELAVTQAINATVGQSQMMAAPQVMRQSSITFGDIHIQNGMDQALFEARVRQIVQEAL